MVDVECPHATVVLASIPFVGHTTPLCMIGAELLRQGMHLKLMLSAVDDEGLIARCQGDLREDPRAELVLVDDGIASKLTKWNSLPPGNCCDEAYPAWLAALEAMEPEPDLVVVDAHTFHAAYAAEELDIPFVTNVPDSFCLLFLLQETVAPDSFTDLAVFFLSSSVRSPFRRHLQKLHRKACCHLVNSFPAWEADKREWPEKIIVVGPQCPRILATGTESGRVNAALQDFPFLSLGGPVVYVSMGSNFSLTKKQCKKLYLGLQSMEEDVKFIWVLRKDFQAAIQGYDPDRFHFIEWAPQRELLASPAVKAVIYHGGFNGICEALTHAKPLLLLPIEGDQFLNADNAAMRGVALQMNRQTFSAQELAQKLRLLLSEDQYTRAAVDMQKSILSTGGSRNAAAVIRDVLSGREFAESTLNPDAPRFSALKAYLLSRVVSCEKRRPRVAVQRPVKKTG